MLRMSQILELAIHVCESAKRKTLTTMDIVYALRVLGSPIYGFGSIVHGDEVRSRAEYMQRRRAEHAANIRAVQLQMERGEKIRSIDEQVRRMGGIVGYR